MAEYRLTPAAARDLEDIFAHTVARWGLSQAIRYTDVLIGAFADLAQSPLSAPACDLIRAGYRRRLVERVAQAKRGDVVEGSISELADSS